MPARLDQLTLGAPDPSTASAFYDAVGAALGLVRIDELVDEEEDGARVEAVAWGTGDGPAFLWLVTAAEPTTGLHLRFRADGRGEVESFHSAAISHGGRSHAAPRRWTLYRRGEFGAAVIDPLGNLVEVVAPE